MVPTKWILFISAETVLLVMIALLALVYALPILCIRRFRHRNNIFTLNVVSHKHAHLSLQRIPCCIAFFQHGICGIPPSTPMAHSYADIGIGVGRIQLRAGIIPSMLLDSVPSEAIFPIEAMDGCVSDWSMACCKYRMHACLRQLAAGKALHFLPVV